jgi:hypothetical protein
MGCHLHGRCTQTHWRSFHVGRSVVSISIPQGFAYEFSWDKGVCVGGIEIFVRTHMMQFFNNTIFRVNQPALAPSSSNDRPRIHCFLLPMPTLAEEPSMRYLSLRRFGLILTVPPISFPLISNTAYSHNRTRSRHEHTLSSFRLAL